MTDLNHTYGFWENCKKLFKNLLDFGVVMDLQVDFLSEHQLSSTFGDLILIEQAKGFNLRHMTRDPYI